MNTKIAPSILTFLWVILLQEIILFAQASVLQEANASSETSAAPISVVSTIPEIAWLVQEIGRQHVHSQSLLTGYENDHAVEAVPEYVIKVMKADMLCRVGLEFEAAWLPAILKKAGKRALFPGSDGFCEIGAALEVLEKNSANQDRSQGDVHPEGNPHFWLSPQHMIQAAQHIRNLLNQKKPEFKTDFENNFLTLKGRLEALILATQERLKLNERALTQPWIMEYHKEFTYFLKVFKFPEAGSVEENPGLLPSASRLAETAQNILNKNIRVILHSPLNPLDRVQKLQTLWQEMPKPPQAIPIWIQIPTHMNQEQFNNDYPIFFQYLVDQIVPQLPAIIPKIEKKAVSKTKSVRKKQKKFRHP